MSESVTESNDGLAGLARAARSVSGGKPPPIHLWNPEHCGDIDIEIRSDGSWWHEGTPIRRQELVRLFASILRREADGHYYLVTPVEKARIRVQLHPLIVIDAEQREEQGGTLWLTLNTGGQLPLDRDHPLALEPRAANAAYVALDNGLTALFSRAAWVRLADMIDANGAITSAGQTFSLLSD